MAAGPTGFSIGCKTLSCINTSLKVSPALTRPNKSMQREITFYRSEMKAKRRRWRAPGNRTQALCVLTTKRNGRVPAFRWEMCKGKTRTKRTWWITDRSHSVMATLLLPGLSHRMHDASSTAPALQGHAARLGPESNAATFTKYTVIALMIYSITSYFAVRSPCLHPHGVIKAGLKDLVGSAGEGSRACSGMCYRQLLLVKP